MDAESDRQKMENEVKYKEELRNQIISDKTTRIQELQDQLFHIEEQLKMKHSVEIKSLEKEIDGWRHQLSQRDQKFEDLEIELENTLVQAEQLNDELNEAKNRKNIMDEVIKELQEQMQQIEANSEEEMEIMNHTIMGLQQQI